MPIARPWIIVAALVAAGVLLLLAAPSAEAGTYRAVQCHDGLDAGHPDAAYRATSDRYRGNADCDTFGLEITHDASPTPAAGGRYGEWALSAPPGTEIVRVHARVAAQGHDWHAPQVATVLAGGARSAIAGVRGSLHTIRWAGEAGRALSARLTCTHRERCGRGEDAVLRMRRISLMLRDTSAPRVGLSGSMLASGSRRGTQGLAVTASDVGGGVRSIVIEVNGEPLATRTFDCRLSQNVAVRLRPCPEAPTAHFDIQTNSPRFRQGPNQVRVCVSDFAPTTNANRTCAVRTVRVDNRCPVSDIHGARLRARFAGGGTSTRVRSDESARVVGRLTGSDGTPVAGAQVCVATRALRPASAERFMATPRTEPDGTFSVRIPAGPSREIRVAHWPGAERALERYLTLTTRAVPKLRLRPRRNLRNGERVRFRASLPGPAAAGRRIEIQARADGRWLRIAGGRTNTRGNWSGSYRFRSTTGRRTYSFRAIVPRQQGYPYEAGASAVRRKTVRG